MSAERYNVGVIGGGAVGLAYTAFLNEVADVVIKTRRLEQAELLNAQGIDLAFDDQEETIKDVKASADMSVLNNCNAIIVTVKSFDTRAVAEELNKVLKPETIVLTLQNGIQAFEVLRATINNPSRVFAGVTYIGSSRLDDRSIKLGDNRLTVIDSNAGKLVKVLEQSKFGAEATTNIKQAVWDKMVLNTGQNALSAVSNLNLGEMLQSDDCLDTAEHLLGEFKLVAEAEGITFDYQLMDKLKDNWTLSTFYPSMWQDLHKGNRTEIDAINGAVSELGKQHNIETPYNAMITSLIKALERNTA